MELTVAWRMPSRPKEQGNLNVHSTNRALDVPSTHLFTFSAASLGRDGAVSHRTQHSGQTFISSEERVSNGERRIAQPERHEQGFPAEWRAWIGSDCAVSRACARSTHYG